MFLNGEQFTFNPVKRFWLNKISICLSSGSHHCCCDHLATTMMRAGRHLPYHSLGSTGQSAADLPLAAVNRDASHDGHCRVLSHYLTFEVVDN